MGQTRRILCVHLVDHLAAPVHTLFRHPDMEFVDSRLLTNTLPFPIRNMSQFNSVVPTFHKTKIKKLATEYHGWFLWTNAQWIDKTAKLIKDLAGHNLLPEKIVVLLLDASRFFRYDALPHIEKMAPYITKIYTCDEEIEERARAIGVNNVEFRWHAAYEWWFRPILCPQKYDACFIGTTYNDGSHGEIPKDQNGTGGMGRVMMIKRFLEAGITNLYVGGSTDWRKLDSRFTDTPLRDHIARYKLCNERSAESKIVLSYDVADCRKFFSVRTANALIAEQFVLTHYKPGFEDLFENHKHLVWFHTLDEAVEKAKYYIPRHNERFRIAKSGRELAEKHLKFEQLVTRIVRDFAG